MFPLEDSCYADAPKHTAIFLLISAAITAQVAFLIANILFVLLFLPLNIIQHPIQFLIEFSEPEEYKYTQGDPL